MDKPWDEIQKQYRTGTFIFSFLIFISFIMTPVYKRSDLTTKQLTLSEKPVFKKVHTKNKKYWVELNFVEGSTQYTIEGVDYKYLNYFLFKDSIDKDDLVTIGVTGGKIYVLEKNGVNYMDFDKAQYHKDQGRIFALGLFITGLICCLIPLFFESHPVLAIGGNNIRIGFGWVLMISLCITFIILSYIIGFQYVSGKEFAT